MHTGILTPFIAGMQPQHMADDSMRDLLEDINEKLQVLIEIQQARQPPYYRQPEVRAERDEIDISWIDPHRWYDNGHFCRIFDIAKITAQKWRSKGLISYIRLGRSVRYPGHEIIRFINVYASPRNYAVIRITEGDEL